jgi:hypothetical protein
MRYSQILIDNAIGNIYASGIRFTARTPEPMAKRKKDSLPSIPERLPTTFTIFLRNGSRLVVKGPTIEAAVEDAGKLKLGFVRGISHWTVGDVPAELEYLSAQWTPLPRASKTVARGKPKELKAIITFEKKKLE